MSSNSAIAADALDDPPDRWPDLTRSEVIAVHQWARRAKAGEQIKLYALGDTLVAVPIERGELERPD
jgi:hypothetical protein